jgi:hypothetical protein
MSTSVAVAATAPFQGRRARKLATLTLIGATLFMVAGGPFGPEELIGNAGYLLVAIAYLMQYWSIACRAKD